MGRFEVDFGCDAGVICFDPTAEANTPFIPRLEARKAILRHRGHEVVAAGFAKFEEFGRHFGADGVQPDIFGAGVTVAIPEEAGERIETTGFELSAQHIFYHGHLSNHLFGGGEQECLEYIFLHVPRSPISWEGAKKSGPTQANRMRFNGLLNFSMLCSIRLNRGLNY